MNEMLTTREFNQRYEIVRNNATGNCLFESISYLINQLPKEEDEVQNEFTHEDIRLLVCDFYKNFDRDIKYPNGCIEESIILGLTYDNDDTDEYGEHILHEINIMNDRVWAGMTDILICSIVFDVDINLYMKNENGFKLEKIKYQYKNKHTLHILYNGINHFEALDQTIFC